MSTDASHLATPATAKTDAVVEAVHQDDIHLPVEPISLDELYHRHQADAATPPLPSNVDVLQAMIAELRQALDGQKQRVAELEQAMDALLRRLQRTPRDAWPADQPALFPEAQASAAMPANEPSPPAPDLVSVRRTTSVIGLSMRCSISPIFQFPLRRDRSWREDSGIEPRSSYGDATLRRGGAAVKAFGLIARRRGCRSRRFTHGGGCSWSAKRSIAQGPLTPGTVCCRARQRP